MDNNTNDANENSTRGWYVLHVFSGYEQKIEKQINNLIKSNEIFARFCYGVKVPMYEQTEIKDGKPKTTMKKLMPGYVLVDLDLPKIKSKDSDDADSRGTDRRNSEEERDKNEKYKFIIGVLKSINGVTGLVGLTTQRNSRPNPLSPSEWNRILEQTGEKKAERTVHATHEYTAGDSIKITTGSFSGFSGTVSEVLQHGKLKVSVEIFGRPTLIEVDAMDTEKK